MPLLRGQPFRPAGVSRCLTVTAALLAGACDAAEVPLRTDAGAPAALCDRDYSRLEDHPPVSLELDLMPVFTSSCTFGSCHGGSPRHGGFLYLGPEEGPVTDVEIEAVYEELLAESTIAHGIRRVVPGHPEHSFLLDKLAGTQAAQHEACNPSAHPCGDEMPPGFTLCLQEGGAERFDRFAAWILQGAPSGLRAEAGPDVE